MYQNAKHHTIHWNILPLFLLLFLVALCVSGCGKKKETHYKGDYIYCLDTNETKIVGEQYTIQKKKTGEMIQELLQRMKKEPNDISLRKAIADTVKIDSFTLSKNGELSLYWTASYGNYSGTAEILRRAAIVKTLCQVPKVKSIEFYVAGQPLTDSNLNAVGFMTADTFIDNTGDVAYTQKATLTVYFGSSNGTTLQGVPVKITYDASIPLAQLALEQLVKGPVSIDGVKSKKLLKTIPDGTQINKVTVKENTCYVDFSKDFLEKRDTISADVAIYSVVDTLIELPNINKVQFSIEGEQVLLYDDSIDFGDPFERNLDIVKED